MTVIILPAFLLFIVHFMGTIAYTPRLTGVLTGRLSLSGTLTNILTIVSRSTNVLIIPLLSGRIESLIAGDTVHKMPPDYFVLLVFALAGSIAGLGFFKYFIGLFYETLIAYKPGANILVTLFKALLVNRNAQHIVTGGEKDRLSGSDYRYFLLNLIITCVYTSATIAAIYSAYIVPQYRLTSLSCSFVINGLATFVFATMVDPYVASLTDGAMADKTKFPQFYYRIQCFLYARIGGVILSFFTFQMFLALIVRCIHLAK